MAGFLIRKIYDATKERLWRRGRSLEGAEPFGDWLVAISRPGGDLDAALHRLRSAPVRAAPLE